MKCPNCGLRSLHTATRCDECGYNFKTGKAPKPTSSQEISSMNGNGKIFISLVGAIISAICFFLPWIGCEGGRRTPSGAEIGGELWVVFIAALVIIAAVFFFKQQKQIEKARPIVAVSSLVALAMLLYEYIKMTNDEFAQFIKFEIKFGSIGTLIGFVLALIGTPFLRRE